MRPRHILEHHLIKQRDECYSPMSGISRPAMISAGGSVQQGLSVAGDVRDSIQLGSATDKRYSLGVRKPVIGLTFPKKEIANGSAV